MDLPHIKGTYIIHKDVLKWIKDLNVTPKTIKLIEEGGGQKLLDSGLRNDFLDTTPKS